MSPVGHPRYRPPEVLKNQLYSKRADVYMFGTVLYSLIFGMMPFQVPKNFFIHTHLFISFSRVYNHAQHPSLPQDMSDDEVACSVSAGNMPDLSVPPNEPGLPLLADLVRRCWNANPKSRPKSHELCTILDMSFSAFEQPELSRSGQIPSVKKKKNPERDDGCAKSKGKGKSKVGGKSKTKSKANKDKDKAAAAAETTVDDLAVSSNTNGKGGSGGGSSLHTSSSAMDLQKSGERFDLPVHRSGSSSSNTIAAAAAAAYSNDGSATDMDVSITTMIIEPLPVALMVAVPVTSPNSQHRSP